MVGVTFIEGYPLIDLHKVHLWLGDILHKRHLLIIFNLREYTYAMQPKYQRETHTHFKAN